MTFTVSTTVGRSIPNDTKWGQEHDLLFIENSVGQEKIFLIYFGILVLNISGKFRSTCLWTLSSP